MKACIYEPENFPQLTEGMDSKVVDAVRWLVNTVYFRKVILKRKTEDNYWIYISAKSLQSVIGPRQKVARQEAIRLGLVECDNTYVVGQKSMGFRLGKATRDVKFKRWAGDGQVFLNRYKRFRADFVKTAEEDALGTYLTSWVKKVRFSRDVERALEGMTSEKRATAECQIKSLREGFIQTKFCEQGRFHSNITGLCKELRNHLEVDGERLVELDVVSSQVLFLADLLVNSNSNLNTKYSYTVHPHSHTHPIPSLHTQYDIKSSFNGFLEDLDSGLIYEKFQDFHGIDSRPLAKDEFFRSVYGFCWMIDPIKAIWPEVADVILRYKHKHDYKWVPCEMQAREAKAILRTACEYLRINHPEIPVLTVHDSILVPERHIQLVHGVLTSALSHLPIKAKIRAKGQLL